MRDPTGPARRDPALVRWGLIAVGVGYLSLFVVVPLANVVVQAFAGGLPGYWRVLARDPDTRHAVRLTLAVAAAAVAANLSFGLAAAWAIARFRFPGRAILIALIDLPFSVSPVVAGLVFVLCRRQQLFECGFVDLPRELLAQLLRGRIDEIDPFGHRPRLAAVSARARSAVLLRLPSGALAARRGISPRRVHPYSRTRLR